MNKKMKNIKYLFFILLAVAVSSCEYFESPDETVAVRKGFITYPAITLNGDQYVTVQAGSDYEDPGVVATLGTEDISGDVLVTGEVDPNTPGMYVLTYSVSIVNELDEEASVSQQRYVAVISESVKDLDLSGTYNGDGTAVAGTWTQMGTVTPVSGAWYRIDKALASANNVGIFFCVYGGGSGEAPDRIGVPSQLSPFGTVNATAAGTSAELTNDGFQWTLFISCCGNFGPIIFSR